jgi:GNAT superfamily N-acetyltransferase
MKIMRSSKVPYMNRKMVFKYSTVIDAIITRPVITINLYVLKDDEDIIIGYSVFETTPKDVVLHWVYVREDWQRLGLATDLVPKNFTVITHMTKDASAILRDMPVRPKLISIPQAYEILENTFQAQPTEINEPNKGEENVPRNADPITPQ